MNEIKFDEQGLVPAVIQDAGSKEVLMVAYMNEEALKKSIETKQTWFYSRSRQELWHKGATSGNKQDIVEIKYDCDKDTLLVLVTPQGPACHEGTYSCFRSQDSEGENQLGTERYDIINHLEAVIAKRDAERPDGAYTTYLFEEGVDKILKKVGEEAAEVIIAAKNRDHNELKWEVADLIYHVLVLLREQNLPLDDVLAVLTERHQS